MMLYQNTKYVTYGGDTVEIRGHVTGPHRGRFYYSSTATWYRISDGKVKRLADGFCSPDGSAPYGDAYDKYGCAVKEIPFDIKGLAEHETTPEYICSLCGSSNVQIAIWTNPNTAELFDWFSSAKEQDAEWCEDCSSHGTVRLAMDVEAELESRG